MIKEAKKAIKEELSRLSVGECVTYPIERYSSVIAGASKFRMEMMRIGWNYKVETDKENFTITIVRIA